MQDAVDVLDVLGAHSIVPHLVVEFLDHGRPQILEQYVTEGGLQVQPHHGFVLERRVGLYVRQVLLQPGVQPLPHGDDILRLGLGRLLGSGRRFGRLPSVDAQQRFHLLPALLLSAGVDALADQLARLGIGAQGDPGLPGAIASFSQISFAVSTLQRHRFLLSSTSPSGTAAISGSFSPPSRTVPSRRGQLRTWRVC